MNIKRNAKTRTIVNSALATILSWLMVFGGLPMQAIAEELLDNGQDAVVATTAGEDGPDAEAVRSADGDDSPAAAAEAQDDAAVSEDDSTDDAGTMQDGAVPADDAASSNAETADDTAPTDDAAPADGALPVAGAPAETVGLQPMAGAERSIQIDVKDLDGNLLSNSEIGSGFDIYVYEMPKSVYQEATSSQGPYGPDYEVLYETFKSYESSIRVTTQGGRYTLTMEDDASADNPYVIFFTGGPFELVDDAGFTPSGSSAYAQPALSDWIVGFSLEYDGSEVTITNNSMTVDDDGVLHGEVFKEDGLVSPVGQIKLDASQYVADLEEEDAPAYPVYVRAIFGTPRHSVSYTPSGARIGTSTQYYQTVVKQISADGTVNIAYPEKGITAGSGMPLPLLFSFYSDQACTQPVSGWNSENAYSQTSPGVWLFPAVLQEDGVLQAMQFPTRPDQMISPIVPEFTLKSDRLSFIVDTNAENPETDLPVFLKVEILNGGTVVASKIVKIEENGKQALPLPKFTMTQGTEYTLHYVVCSDEAGSTPNTDWDLERTRTFTIDDSMTPIDADTGVEITTITISNKAMGSLNVPLATILGNRDASEFLPTTIEVTISGSGDTHITPVSVTRTLTSVDEANEALTIQSEPGEVFEPGTYTVSWKFFTDASMNRTDGRWPRGSKECELTGNGILNRNGEAFILRFAPVNVTITPQATEDEITVDADNPLYIKITGSISFSGLNPQINWTGERTNLDSFTAELPLMTFAPRTVSDGASFSLRATVMTSSAYSTADRSWMSDGGGSTHSQAVTAYMSYNGELQYEKEYTDTYMDDWGNTHQTTRTEWTPLVLRPEYMANKKPMSIKIHVNVPEGVEHPYLWREALGDQTRPGYSTSTINGWDECVHIRLYRETPDGMELIDGDPNTYGTSYSGNSNYIDITTMDDNGNLEMRFESALEEGTYYITWFMGSHYYNSRPDPAWIEHADPVKITVDHDNSYVTGEDGEPYVVELYYNDEYRNLVQPVIDVDFTQPDEYVPNKYFQVESSRYSNYVNKYNPPSYTVTMTPLWENANPKFSINKTFSFKGYETYQNSCKWAFSFLEDGSNQHIGTEPDYTDYTAYKMHEVGATHSSSDNPRDTKTVGSLYSDVLGYSSQYPSGEYHSYHYYSYFNGTSRDSFLENDYYYEYEYFVGYPVGDYQISYRVNSFTNDWHRETATVHLAEDGRLYQINDDGSYADEPYTIRLFMEDSSVPPAAKTFEKLTIQVDTSVNDGVSTDHAFSDGETFFAGLVYYDSANANFENSYVLVASGTATITETGTTTLDLLPVDGDTIPIYEDKNYSIIYGTYTGTSGEYSYTWTPRWYHAQWWLNARNAFAEDGTVLQEDYSGGGMQLVPFVARNESMLLPWDETDPKAVTQYDGDNGITLMPITSYSQVQDGSTYMIVVHNNYDGNWYALAYDEAGGHQVLLEDVTSVDDLKAGYVINEKSVQGSFLLTASKAKQAEDSVQLQLKTNAKDENGKTVAVKMGTSSKELEPLLSSSAGTIIIRSMAADDPDAPTFQVWKGGYATLAYNDELFGRSGFYTVGVKNSEEGYFRGYHIFPVAANRYEAGASYWRVNQYVYNSYFYEYPGPYMVEAPAPLYASYSAEYIYDGDPRYISSEYLDGSSGFINFNSSYGPGQFQQHMDFYILSDNQEENPAEENNTYTRVLTFGDFNNTFIQNGGSSSTMLLVYTDDDGAEWALTPGGLVQVKSKDGAGGYDKVLTGGQNELIPNNNSGTSETFGFACVDVSGASEQVFATDYAFRRSRQSSATGQYLTLKGDEAWTTRDDSEHGDGLVYVLQPTTPVRSQSEWDDVVSYKLSVIRNGETTWLGVSDGQMVPVDSEEEAVVFDVYAPKLTRYYSSAYSSDMQRFFRVYNLEDINAGDEILIVYRDENGDRHTVSWSTGEASRETYSWSFSFPALDVLDEYSTINTHDTEFPDGARYKYRLDTDDVEKQPYAYMDPDNPDLIWAQGVAANGIGVAKNESSTQRKYESVVGLGNQMFYLRGQADSNPLYHTAKSEINFFAAEEPGTFYIRGGKSNVYLCTSPYSVQELNLYTGRYEYSRSVLSFRAFQTESPAAFEVYRRARSNQDFVVEYYDVNDLAGDPVRTEIRPQEALTLPQETDITDTDGTAYIFVGWTADPEKAGKLPVEESANIFDYDDVAKFASVREDVLESHALLGPCDPESANVVPYATIETLLAPPDEDGGAPVLKLYPVYAVRGFSQAVTADEDDGTMIIGIADCKDFEMGGDGSAEAKERWLGSVNVVVYLDGELWVPGKSTSGEPHATPGLGRMSVDDISAFIRTMADEEPETTATMYFSYHNDDAADLNIKFIEDGIDAAGLLDYLSNDEFSQAEPTERYVIDAVYAEQGGSEDGLKYRYNWMSPDYGGQLDNVRGGSTVYVYVTTKYQVKYYLDHDADGIYDELPNVPDGLNTDEGYTNPNFYTTVGTEQAVDAIKDTTDYYVTADNEYKKLMEQSPGDTTTFRDDAIRRGEYSTFLYKFDEYEHEIPIMPLPTELPDNFELASDVWSICLEKDAGSKKAEQAPSSTLAVTETTRGTGTTAYTSKREVLNDDAFTYHLFIQAVPENTVLASIPVQKVLDAADDVTAPDITGAYTFTLEPVDDAPMVGATGNAIVAEKANPSEEGGMVTFGPIAFTSEGTYKYLVREAPTGDPVLGIKDDADAQTGKEVVVTVEPAQDGEGFVVTVSSTSDDPLTFTNTYETVDIPVAKVWADSNDAGGLRPDETTFVLLADGEETDEELVLSEDGNWIGSFNDLPKYRDGGIEIVYSISERDVPRGYKAEDPVTDDDGVLTITNTLATAPEPETVEVSVAKVWDDADNADGIRPETVTVRLLADGEEVATAEFGASEDWKHAFDDLPKLADDGETEIVYTVEEVGVPEGYEAKVEGDASSGFTITNTHVPEPEPEPEPVPEPEPEPPTPPKPTPPTPSKPETPATGDATFAVWPLVILGAALLFVSRRAFRKED